MKGIFRTAATLLCLPSLAVWAAPGLDHAQEIPLGAAPSGLAAADFNSDGQTDFAVVADTVLAVYLGDGSGGVAELPAATTPVARFHAIAVGNFDGDSNVDVAAIHEDSDYISVLFGHGDGSFTSAVSLMTEAGPHDLQAFDLNSDGADDLVVANADADSITVFLSNNDGTFGIGDHVTAGDFPAVLRVVDGNVVVLNAMDGTVQVFTNDGVGVLTTSDSSIFSAGSISGAAGATFPAALASTDLDTDGFNDIVIGNLASNELYVLYGDALGDFGNGEALTSDWHSAEVQVDPAASEYQVDGVTRLPKPLALGDVVGDSNPDLVVAALNRKALLVFPGNNDGDFDSVQVFATPKGIDAISIHDLDGAGLADAVGLAADSLQLFANVDSVNRAPVVFDSVLHLEECSESAFSLAHDIDGDPLIFSTVSILANHPATFRAFLPVLQVQTFDTGENAILEVATMDFTVDDGKSISRAGSLRIEVMGDGDGGECNMGNVLEIVDLRASESAALQTGATITALEVSITAPNVSLDVTETGFDEDGETGGSCESGTVTIDDGGISTGSGFCSDFELSDGIVTVSSGVSVSHDGSVIIVDSSGNSSDDTEKDEDVVVENETTNESAADPSEGEGGGGAWFWLGLPLLFLRRRT